tara:strand:- start:5744 stop:6304 length:561 start_codon:yes stop_codon:yes gene_type:complete
MMQQPSPDTSVQALDRFNRPPPGHSLTGPQGKWSWEKPPRFADPEEAIDFVIDQMETPTVKNDMLSLMLAGISIEEIVDSVGIGGFATGHFNPDVAELIKAPIAVYLAGLAIENDIQPKMFNTKDGMPQEDGNVDEAQVMNIMQDRSPETLQVMAEMENQEQQTEDSFLSSKLDEQPVQEEIKEEV